MYKCDTVTQAVCSSTFPCSEVNQVCALDEKVVYTDTKAGKVMQYNPDDNSVRALVGSVHNSYSNGTQDSCSFKQIEGICSVVCYRCFRWKGECSNEPFRNDIFPNGKFLVPFTIPLEF